MELGHYGAGTAGSVWRVEAIVQLVGDTLLSALVKLFAGAGCAAGGLWGLRREKPGKAR